MKQKNITSTSDLNELYDQLHAVSELRFPLEDYPHFLRLLNERKKLRNGNKILDIGCGQGFLLREAEKMGLVNYVVHHEELMDKAMKLARKIASHPSAVIGTMKDILNRSMYMDLHSLLELEEQTQVKCTQSDNYKEGVRAFLERREPNYV